MRTLLEKLIADYQKISHAQGIKRDVRFPSPLPHKARVITGVRRCGKTWLLHQVIQKLQKKDKIPGEKILYLNFEDERFLIRNVNFSEIIETFYGMYPQTDDMPCFFFFDEIQNFPGWDRFIRRLLETEDIRIYLTGSSAKLLSTEIATSLRGRSLSTELFPFSFREFLRAKGIETNKMPDVRTRGMLVRFFQQFILEGGFPEVVNLDDKMDKIALLQEYARSIMYHDVAERYGITNLKALKYFISTVLNAPASLFSVSKFYNHLKSLQIPCKKDALYSYVSHFHDAYLLFPVSIYTRSEKARQVNPRKIYIVDTGLAHAHSKWPEPDWGHLFENFVFLELRKRNFKISYYKTRTGKEVDFVVHDNISKESFLVQASLELTQKPTAKREIKALAEAAEETGIKHAWIVTANTFDEISTPSCTIQVVPGWWWSLALDKEIEQAREKQKDIRMPGLEYH